MLVKLKSEQLQTSHNLGIWSGECSAKGDPTEGVDIGGVNISMVPIGTGFHVTLEMEGRPMEQANEVQA